MEYARVNYQETVDTDAGVSDQTRDRLRTVPFPAYPQPNYATVENYSATKVVPLDDRFCVSWITYRGETDRDDRPLLTADVALLSVDEFRRNGRDVILVRDYLRRAGVDATPTGFDQFRTERETIADEAVFRDTCSSFQTDFLGVALAQLIEDGEAILACENRSRAITLLRIAWGILPLSALTELSFCTDCTHPERGDAEDFVLSAATTAGNEGLLGRSQSPEAHIDLERESASGGTHASLLEGALSELLERDPWYDFTWSEQYSLLVEHIAGVYEEDGSELTDRSERLAAMKETIDRIETLGSSETNRQNGWFL